jgi:uncharacterized membrane protein YeiB
VTSRRIDGLDAARGLAVLGMFIAHTVPVPLTVDTVADGRSSILFATIAGVSLGLLSGGAPAPARDRRGGIRLSVGVRGAILLVLGFFLATLGSLVSIILDEYGLMYLLLLPVLFAPRFVLVPLAAFFAIAGPVLVGLLSEARDAGSAIVGMWFGPDASYPVPLWLAYLLAGLIVARSDLRRTRTQLLTIAAGVVGMVLGYGVLGSLGADVEAHADTTAEAFGSGGVALLVIGALAYLLSPETGGLGRVLRTVLSPLTAVGAMPLTIYTAQILVLAVVAQLGRESGLPYGRGYYPLALLLSLVIGSLVVAWLWRRFLGRGPLERALASIADPLRVTVHADEEHRGAAPPR